MNEQQLSKNVLYYGVDTPLPESRRLRAGPLSVIFEGGDLRYVRLNQHELLRRIYVAVRDHNWDTIPGELRDLTIDETADSFTISFTMVHHQGEIHFAWRGEIRGSNSSEITFSMDGQAHSAFRRNRIGFCILHPAACAGLPCSVEHIDGSHTEGCFPVEISPHQPFVEMQAITHVIDDNTNNTGTDDPARVEVRFAGDIFEMEDQRNWTDASYKTYCTPLRIPYPVQVEPGDVVQQSVSIRLLGTATTEPDSATPQATELTISDTPSGTLPAIGLGSASHGESFSMQEINRLRALSPSHLRIDLQPDSRAFVNVVRDAWRDAAFLGASLEVGLFLSGDEEAAARQLGFVARAVGEFNPDISRWLIFHIDEVSTTETWLHLARETLSIITPQAQFVAGTNAYFTELNRERPPVLDLDNSGVCYSINPQVHAFDNQSLVETLATQADTVTSARAFAGDLPICISPVTLRPRFNPNATGPEPEPAPGELPAEVDPRQMSLFGAGWTVGSVKYLAQAGAAAITYYETTGWRGVMEQAGGSPLPDQFRSLPGAVFPLYHVLADIGEFAGAQILPVSTSDNLSADGLALVAPDGRRRVLVANLTPHARTIHMRGLRAATVTLKIIDEHNVLEAMQEPEQFRAAPGESHNTDAGTLTLELAPFAVARLDQAST